MFNIINVCDRTVIISPILKKFGDIMFLVWTSSQPPSAPPPTNAKTCVSRNCDTNAHIKFIFDTAIVDQESKKPIDFSENRYTIMADGGHFIENMPNSLCMPYFHPNTPINFIFDVAIDLLGRKVPIDFGENWVMKMASGGHLKKVAY